MDNATTLSLAMVTRVRTRASSGVDSGISIPTKEPPAIRMTGIRMVRKEAKVPGRSLSLISRSSTLSEVVSSISAVTSGTAGIHSLAAQRFRMSQVAKKVMMVTTMPQEITMPRSADRATDTARMPGVGGTMAWVRFRPVWVKEAMVDMEMCLRLPRTFAMLEHRMVVMSPNTGMDTT